MAERVNRQWVLKSRPVVEMGRDNFEYRETSIPTPAEGEILVRTCYLSFDPTQRMWATLDTYLPAVELGEPMRAFAVGQVVESKNRKYKVGTLVAGLLSWQDYMVLRPEETGRFRALPPGLDPKLAVALAVTGLTAYFGLLEVGQLKRGDQVLVSAAAGATGSMVAQIARIKGCRVVGIAGGPEKCRWVKETAGADAVIDYKREDVATRIAELFPKGIDLYFDNVGGEILEAALETLAKRARIVLCGAISQYSKIREGMPKHASPLYGWFGLIMARARMEGFLVTDYFDRAQEALFPLLKWIDEGKLVQEIDLQEGFENIPQTLTRLFEGKNLGKQMLKITEPPLAVPGSPTLFRLGRKLLSLRYR